MAGVWARRLRPASFRGVPFKVGSHTYGTGRKGVVHDVPGNDKHYVEDLGRKTRTFDIQGWVLGDDVFRFRDNLIAACEQEGAGELVHPYLGTKQVQCIDFSFSENNDDGRIVNFSIKFKEAGSPNFPAGIFDNIAKFFDAANNAVDAVGAAFEAVYNIANVPGFVVDEAVNTINTAIDQVQSAVEKVRTIPAKKSEILAKLQTLRGQSNILARDAELLGVEITNVIKDLKDAVAEPEDTDAVDVTSGSDDKITVFDDLINFNRDQVVILTGTPSQVRQSANTEAINDLVRQNAIISSSEASVVKTYTTLSDAESQKDNLVDFIENVLDTTEDDTVFQTFSDLKSFIIKTVPNEDLILSTELSFELKQTNPSLTIVYDKTGSIDNESDFLKRNKIRNPAFVEPKEYTVLNG